MTTIPSSMPKMEAIGIDIYNLAVTGNIAPTLNAASGGSPTRSGPFVLEYDLNRTSEEVKDASNRH